MDFTVIIPFRDDHAGLAALLGDLPADLSVLVVDDVSAQTPDLAAWPNARLLRLAQRGYFAGAVNAGLAATAGDVLVLNQDMRLHGDRWRDWLAEQRGRYAIAGTGQLKHPAWPAGYVQGQFMWLDHAARVTVGLFNERDYPLWGGTAEWQLRACRQGYAALPVAEVPGVTHARPPGVLFGAAIAEAVQAEPQQSSWLVRTPPLISVIITSHSYGRYLLDAVHSLIGGPTSLGHMPGQTLQSFEVIIVDDASTDETAEVGQALANAWTGVRYLRRAENGGTPAANNTGIRAAFGQFITILCADDMREPDSLDYLYRVVERNPRAVAYDDIQAFGQGQRLEWYPDNERGQGGQRIPGRLPMGEYGFDSLVKKNMMHAGIMFARRAWDETGGYHESMRDGREDWQFNIALGLKGYCGKRVPRYGYLYRREGQNRSLHNGGTEWRASFDGQLRAIFPALYQGVKPMGCCGSGGEPAPRSSGFEGSGGGAEEFSVGQQGMVLLDYLGGNDGEESWYGPATQTRYLFGGRRKQGYVDARDVQAMLDLRQSRRPVFELAAVAPAAEAKPAAPAHHAAPVMSVTGPVEDVTVTNLTTGEPLKADQIGPVATEPIPAAEAETPAADLAVDEPPADFAYPLKGVSGWFDADPRVHSIASLTKLLGEVQPSAAQLGRMLAMEKGAAAPRKGVVALLEKALDAPA